MVTVRGTRLLYSLKNVDGVYSCSCQSWKRQTRHPDFRTCKHLITYRGAEAEAIRIFPAGRAVPPSQAPLLDPFWPKKKGKTPPPPPVAASLWDRLGGDDPFGEVP
jgi:hypothetical protein